MSFDETRELLRVRRQKGLFTITTFDQQLIDQVMRAATSGQPDDFGFVRGFVQSITSLPPFLGNNLVEIVIRPTGAPLSISQELQFNLPVKEASMKVYEAVVVKTNESGEVVEVVKVVPPFTSKNEGTAQKEVLVDYAQENKLSGKEAAAVRVSVREFCTL